MRNFRMAVSGAIIMIIGAASSAEVLIPPNYQISSPSDELQTEEQVVVNPFNSLNAGVTFGDKRMENCPNIGCGRCRLPDRLHFKWRCHAGRGVLLIRGESMD